MSEPNNPPKPNDPPKPNNLQKPKKQGLFRELFSDSAGRLSAFRVMAMIATLSGCAVIILQALGHSKMDLNTPLAFLFGGVFGGKAAQKFAEKDL